MISFYNNISFHYIIYIAFIIRLHEIGYFNYRNTNYQRLRKMKFNINYFLLNHKKIDNIMKLIDMKRKISFHYRNYNNYLI